MKPNTPSGEPTTGHFPVLPPLVTGKLLLHHSYSITKLKQILTTK